MDVRKAFSFSKSRRAIEAVWLGDEGWGLSAGKLTCRGVFETCSPQDVYLGHLLGIAAQGAPAGAGRLVQAQLPGAGRGEEVGGLSFKATLQLIELVVGESRPSFTRLFGSHRGTLSAT